MFTKIDIPILSRLLHYYKIFFKYTSYRLFVLLFIILFGGIFEGLSISIIIPLLDYERDDISGSKYSDLVYQFLNFTGLGVSLKSILFMLVIAFTVKGVFTICQTIYSSRLLTKLANEIKQNLCIKFSQASYGYFINKPLGYFNNIITTEAGTAVSGLNNYINVIICITHISIYVLSASLINSTLTLFVLAISIIIFYCFRSFSKYIEKLSFLVTKTNAQIQSYTIQKLYYFKYLKATDTFKPILKFIFDKIEDHRKYQLHMQIYNAIPSSMIELISIIFLSVLVWYYVDIKNKQIGEILVILLFFWRTLNRVLNFQNYWQRFCSYAGAINVVNDSYKELDNNRENISGIPVKELKKSIKFQNINFSYGNKKVLYDIKLEIPKKKCIGIVGPSGAGKTSLFDLLVGLLTPQSGSIKIDEINYRDLDINCLRQIVGYVTQEPVVFNDTIKNNISFWQCGGSEFECQAEVEKAANLAHCTSFIKECENGFDTVIGDKGVKLSGGQRQRIAIARELFKNPKIMVFDEATSSLDTKSEKYIQQSINSMMGKLTILIVAHRLSTVKNCDLIYVLNEGRIVESGSFDDLYGKVGGVFKLMCKEQNL